MDTLISLIVVIISFDTYIQTSHCTLKHIQLLFVNYASVKVEKYKIIMLKKKSRKKHDSIKIYNANN